MGTRREELSTADLAGQPPTSAERSDVTARDDRTETADPTDDDVARDDLPGEPTLTGGRSPDLATDVEPGEEPQPLRQDYGRHEVTATGTDPDLASITAAPAAQAAPDAGTPDTATKAGHLLAADDAEAFRARWTDVQHGFVDAPRQAVEQADGLVAELMQHLAKTFTDERGRLEGQWDQGDDVSTEDLRTAFQRYRLFFERLLTT
jgi:hypothetical protein